MFPYNFLRSYENLEQKEFPPYEGFSSELTGQRIDPQLYDKAKTAYETDPTMHCFLDYLRAYNNNDVEPFFKAVSEQQRWFSQQGLDIFRDGLTLSSHANKIMCRFPLRAADQLTEAHLEELAVPPPLTVTVTQIQKRITAYKEHGNRHQQKRGRAVGGSSSSSSRSSSSSSAGAVNGGAAANKRVSPAARWSAPKRRKVDRFLDVEAAPPADDSGDESVDDDDMTQDPSLGGFLVGDDEGEGDDDDRTFSCMVSCRSFLCWSTRSRVRVVRFLFGCVVSTVMSLAAEEPKGFPRVFVVADDDENDHDDGNSDDGDDDGEGDGTFSHTVFCCFVSLYGGFMGYVVVVGGPVRAW